MTCSVLVPLDGSDFCEYAIAPAVEMAHNLEAGLELVSVVPDYSLIAVGDPTVATIPVAAQEGEQHRLAKYLEDIARRLEEKGVSGVRTVLLHGDVSRALEEQSEQHGCAMIVMCTHGRGPLSRAWLGSVTDELVRHAAVPVLIVRPDETCGAGDFTPTAFKRILVPLDGTDTAECCLDWAVKTARSEHASLDLLWVTYPNDQIPSPFGAGTVVDGVTEEEHRKVAHAYLQEQARTIEERSLEVRTHITSAVQVAPEILYQAKQLDADMIAMATHGRGGLARAALGSVTDKVVRGSDVPVLVTRKTAT